MNLVNNDEFAKLVDDPYRTSAKPMKEKYIRTPEEVIQSLRNKIPGPIRRFLGVVLFVPTYVLSTLLVLTVAPILYIITGDWLRWLDTTGGRETPTMFFRGTHTLFFEQNKYDIERLRRHLGYALLEKNEDFDEYEDSEYQSG